MNCDPVHLRPINHDIFSDDDPRCLAPTGSYLGPSVESPTLRPSTSLLSDLALSLSRVPASPRKARGALFEEFAAKLLTALGSSVYEPHGPEVDWVAEFQGKFMKVECRFKEHDRLTAGEIREFVERVRHGPSAYVGLLLTNSIMPSTATRLLERATPHQVIIIDGQDLQKLLTGGENLEGLLSRKGVEAAGGIWEPRGHGRKRVFSERARRLKPPSLVLSSPAIYLAGRLSTYLTNRSRGPMCLVFSPIWYRAGSRSYILEAVFTRNVYVRDTQQLLAHFDDCFGFTEGGAFTIAQDPVSWHGFGARDFVTALNEQRKRYQASGLSEYHHTETALFIDEVRLSGGADCLFWVAAQPSTSKRMLTHFSCGFLVSEILFPTKRFERFFDLIGESPDVYETWENLKTHHYRPRDKLSIQPVGLLTARDTDGEQLVRGLIVRRSDFDLVDDDLPRGPEHWTFKSLGDSGLWLTDLRGGWHEPFVRPEYQMGLVRAVEVPAPGFGGALISAEARSVFRKRPN